MTDVIAYAIPGFVILIALEIWIDRRRGSGYYETDAALTDLSCGVGNQVLDVFVRVGIFAAYVALFALTPWQLTPDSPWTWVGAVIGVDLLFYIWHRASHRINVMWAVHAVHHQSEEFNLCTALRQELFNKFTQLGFYLPLALLGVPPIVFATTVALSTVYMFWVHTRLIGKLGPLEWVLNTPSHHRVHHGRDPEYLDKNYAGVFIVWDRLFGTFAEETREPTYGTVKPFHSRNPVWANIEPFLSLFRQAQRFERIGDKLRLWVMPPGWAPADAGGYPAIPDPVTDPRPKHRTPHGLGVTVWSALNFALAVGLLGLILLPDVGLAPGTRAALGAGIVWTTISIGGLAEQRRWVVPAEVGRLLFLAGVGLAATGYVSG